jgi:hypothetical protein
MLPVVFSPKAAFTSSLKQTPAHGAKHQTGPGTHPGKKKCRPPWVTGKKPTEEENLREGGNGISLLHANT